MTSKPTQSIGQLEFVMLMAAMLATTAFSIDAMLPAMGEIAADITPDLPARASWVLTSFVIGLGIGTFFAGPLSDAFGRKPVLCAGTAIYVGAAVWAWLAHSLEAVLIARMVQGLGGAAPRVVSMAIIRDLYAGREMARIVSFCMTIFILVPAIAPATGAVIIAYFGWRGIFGAFIVFAVLTLGWLHFRIKEPLPLEGRRPLKLSSLVASISEVMRHTTVRRAIIVQTLVMAMLFSVLTMIHPIYDVTYDKNDSFPFWFALVAVFSGAASLLNAAIVVRLGMQAVITWTMCLQVTISALILLVMWTDSAAYFWLFLLWQFVLFCQASLVIGNLNALAMEPMGHIAGTAASVVGAIATVFAALIASPIGLLFDGTPRPLLIAIIALTIPSVVVMLRIGRAS